MMKNFNKYLLSAMLVVSPNLSFAESGTLSSQSVNVQSMASEKSKADEIQQRVADQARQSAEQSRSLVDAANSQKKAAKKKMIMAAAVGVGLGVMAAIDGMTCAASFGTGASDGGTAATNAGNAAASGLVNFLPFRIFAGNHPCILTAVEAIGVISMVKLTLDAKKEMKRAKESMEAAKAANFDGKGGNYRDTRTGELGADSERESDPATLAALEFQNKASTAAIKALSSISQKTKGKIAINPNKGTMTINGKEYQLPPLEKQALVAAGMSPAQVDNALAQLSSASQNALKNLNQNPQLASIMKDSPGGDDFGGGGGAGFAAFANAQGDQNAELNANTMNHRLPSSADTNAKLDGMSKNYNGEPIGVAQDELFGMMSRRYKAVENQNHFLQ